MKEWWEIRQSRVSRGTICQTSYQSFPVKEARTSREPIYITRNIISPQQRVYGYTKTRTNISKDHQLHYLTVACLILALKPEVLRSDLERKETVNSSQNSSLSRLSGFLLYQRRGKSVKSFAYTVIYKTPPNSLPIRYQSEAVARRQALGTRQAEIGIASFMDHASHRNMEKSTFRSRWNVKSGRRIPKTMHNMNPSFHVR